MKIDNYLKSLFKKYAWAFVGVFLLGMAIVVGGIMLDIWGAEMISSIKADGVDKTKQIILSFAILSVVFVGIETFTALLGAKIRTKIMDKYITHMNEHLRKVKTQSVESTSTGVIENYVTNDAFTIINVFYNSLWALIYTVYHFVVCVYMFCLNIYFGFVAMAMLLVYAIGEMFFYKKIVRREKATRRTNILYNSFNIEVINSNEDAKALYTKKYIKQEQQKRIRNVDEGKYQLSMASLRKSALLSTYWEVVIAFVPVVLGLMMQSYVFAFASLIFIFKNIGMLKYFYQDSARLINNMSVINSRLDNVNTFLDIDEFPTDNYGDVEIEKLKGDIEFRNVAFSYDYVYFKENDTLNYEQIWQEEKERKFKAIDAKKKTMEKEVYKNQVFEDLNFKIKAGQTVAFVGESGSGKSTILNLIAKFATCDGGQVLLDGIDINDLSKQTIRNNICMVSQNTYIFNGTIKENLLLVKKDATDEEILTACEKAYMGEFLDSLDKGLDTVVGENGIKLSGGQRQRLAIARAFLKDSQIVIFDESTSALDNKAQAYVQESISQFKGKTIIIVAHRLSTIVNADKIYYLQEGKIVCSGKFETLMKKDESFRELFLSESDM